jgi:hypothetical protein
MMQRELNLGMRKARLVLGFVVLWVLGLWAFWVGWVAGVFAFCWVLGLWELPVYMAYELRGPPYAFSKKLHITYLKRISQHTAR